MFVANRNCNNSIQILSVFYKLSLDLTYDITFIAEMYGRAREGKREVKKYSIQFVRRAYVQNNTVLNSAFFL